MSLERKMLILGVIMTANKSKNSSLNLGGFFTRDNLPLITLIIFAIFAIVAIVVSTLVFHINVVIACVMVVLEAALAACLNRIPLWIHGLVFIAQIVCGVLATQIPFMVLVAFIYVFAIAFLYIWNNK